jgi:ribosomal protein S18 acetylase RimI-like enzyme
MKPHGEGYAVAPLTPSLLPGLTPLVNQHMRLVPPGWEFTEEQVTRVIASANSLWRHHHPDVEAGDLDTFCLLDSGRLVAAAQLNHYAADPEDQDSAPETYVLWAFADPQVDGAADALFAEIVRRARGAKIDAGSRHAFGVGWLGLPVVWPHLVDAAARHGFVAKWEWVIMTGEAAPLVAAAQPAPPGELSWRVDEQAREWNLTLRRDGEMVAECQVWGIPPHFAGCPEFDEWAVVEWIGVEEPFRRQGLARFLLREQARFHATRGIAHFLLYTETDNAEFQAFATALGFQFGPRCSRLYRAA